MTFGGSDANYSWVLPGGPYVDNTMYYVKIAYAEASGSLKANDAGISYPTRYTDSYFVTINSAIPISGEILLATFTGDTSAHIKSTIKDERLYIRALVPASGIIVDPTVKPFGACITAEDHILAVGNGTPSATNPHGLTGDDIGLSDTTGPHRKEAHIPAIVDITGQYPNIPSFSNSYLGVPYDSGAVAGIAWTAAHASASIMVNGAVYHPALDTVDFTTHPDITGDATYYFYYTGTGSAVRATTTNIAPTEFGYHTYDKFTLCRIDVGGGGSEYSNFEDLRKFYSISQIHIRAEASPEYAVLTTITSTSTLWDNLSRIRYQLALALNGSDWAGSNPLTAGYSSRADVYHTHVGVNSRNFLVNNGSTLVPNYTWYGFGIYFGGAFNALMYNNLTGWSLYNSSAAYDSLTLSYIYATAGYINVGASQLTATHVAAMPTLTGGSTTNADTYHTHTSLLVPATGSLIAYNNNGTRRNASTRPLFVSSWAFDDGTGGDFSLFVAPTSASLVANEVQHQRVPAGNNYASIFGVVPPYWFYKVFYDADINLNTLKVYEYPATGVSGEGDSEPAP